MAKCILMSIKPKYVSMILNKVKTIEVRKRFPSDYVGWVYIYVTHGRQLLDLRNEDTKDNYRLTISKSNDVRWSYPPLLNGKVVARFWCDKVEEIEKSKYNLCYTSESLTEMNLLKHSCLSFKELHDYFQGKNGYAIHITKLEIFDKPKEISEYFEWTDKKIEWYTGLPKCKVMRSLTRAPQSWQYIEI